MTGKVAPPLVVAALFALHPQRVESVAWVAERKDVLAGTFFFLTLLAYARYARSPSKLGYVLVALALALGLMAKQMLVTLPFLLLVLDAWPLGRWKDGAGTRLVLEKLPLVLLAVGGAGSWGFAVTLTAGVIAGTLSSIFVACPLLLLRVREN